MSTSAATAADQRTPLSRERILRAAIGLADDEGIEAVTMRNLAARLGVEAMSLYHHIANKEALLDGVVDALVAEIGEDLGGFAADADSDTWKATLRHRILTARSVMLRHRWAPALIETRTSMTPTLLQYMDSILGIMINGGFSYDLGHHAMHALGSLALGFNQELFAPADPNQSDEAGRAMLEDLAPRLPYIVSMLADVTHDGPETTIGWCDDQTEFEFALDLMLDGLERRLTSS